MTTTTTAAAIRVGVGGWTFEPWRNTLYPAGGDARELEYRAGNSPHRGQRHLLPPATPGHFAKWRSRRRTTSFLGKATRYATNRRCWPRPVTRSTVRAQRNRRARPEARARSSGSSRRPNASKRRISRASCSCCPAVDGVALRHAVEVRHRVSRARPTSHWRAGIGGHGVHRLRRLSVVRRPDRRLRLRAHDARRQVVARRVAPQAVAQRPRARASGAMVASPSAAAHQPPPRRWHRATCFCSSSAPTRKRRRPPRWRLSSTCVTAERFVGHAGRCWQPSALASRICQGVICRSSAGSCPSRDRAPASGAQLPAMPPR